MEKRSGTKFAFAESDPDKIIVSTVEWRGFIYIATQKGIYRLEEDNTVVRLQMIDKGGEDTFTH